MEGTPIDVFRQKEALQSVQLDVPEVVQFLTSFEEKMGKPINFSNQSIDEIATSISEIVKGVE